MGFSFRRAELYDVEALVRLEYELFPENNFGERVLEKVLGNGCAFLAHADGVAIGYALCANAEGDTNLVDMIRLGVSSTHQRLGIGSRLLEYVIRLNRTVMLTVRQANTPALKLYKKYGFEITSFMPQHESWIMLRPTSS